MKIIIVGIGKLGEYLTRNLVKENNEITVIDNDYTTSKDLINNVDVNYVDGSGLDPNVLIEAGVKTPLLQNGDFRSDECIALLKEADIVVTNPPFSLFREYRY